ncbi:Glutathione synthase/RimK-type ligase, ATP-grasp superfamily [Thermoactinomyces sp. DSM 45891]|uniref:YheC/YheD family endospore coat-associated protein n=1 Tax=Thermoactinomyces sp. DSM 45891 TaxID=1761907 RepID=UPI0009147E59|nr:YheC/YheD family protein [Thermoactinomyces sp. DSM 45891]SFX60087.1 Glutathione synthase/RimK-type ligase, ATP-grasp superfamily [Thermoactinomyces sp. DSM 45891]
MDHLPTGWLSLANGKPHTFFPHPSFHNSLQERKTLPISLDGESEVDLPINLNPPHNLHQVVPTRLRKKEDGKIVTGPFIAILSSDNRYPFSGNHYNFRDIIKMGKKMGVTVYVTTPKYLSQSGDVVKGYLLDSKSKRIKWIPSLLPRPNVIYNRIPSRKAEKQMSVQAVLQKIKHSSTPIFNPHYFDKWTLHKQLSSDENCAKYLPITMRIDQESVLQTLLTSHNSIMLKPVEGKAGIGMMKVTKKPAGYECIIQTLREKKRYNLATISDVWRVISPYTQNRAYIAQQYIPLAQYGNCPFDVRMLFQKNMTGEWGLTGIGVRVAGAKAITTHVPMGGRIESAVKVFTSIFGDQEAKKIRDKLERIGITIAKTIEKKQGYPLGEMSMDIGLERTGRPWFFEANAKPMKFDEPNIREKSLRRLIQYSLYLSEKAKKKQEIKA